MRNRWQVTVGVAIIVIGAIFLISALTGFNVWGLVCPGVLIALGVALLVQARRVSPGTIFSVKLLGDIRRGDDWKVSDQEMWVGIADVDLDLSDAELPTGETKLRLVGFVGDIELRVPEGVGLSIASMSFVTDAKIFGHQTTSIIAPFEFTSQDYTIAPRQIRVETLFFVTDLKVRQSKPYGTASTAGTLQG